MFYYTVTERRARALDRLNLRDRATYGVDWMVFEATSAADAVRQWNRFKAGNHVRQAELELEANSYRAGIPGYAAPWEAESEAALEEAQQALTRLVKPAAEARRRAAPIRKRRARAKTQRTTKKTTAGERRKPVTKRQGKSKESEASARRRQGRKRTG